LLAAVQALTGWGLPSSRSQVQT